MKHLTRLFQRLFCFFGLHFGELYRGSSPHSGLTVLKRCACGRYWYDAAGPFADPIWIPITVEELQAWDRYCEREGEIEH